MHNCTDFLNSPRFKTHAYFPKEVFFFNVIPHFLTKNLRILFTSLLTMDSPDSKYFPITGNVHQDTIRCGECVQLLITAAVKMLEMDNKWSKNSSDSFQNAIKTLDYFKKSYDDRTKEDKDQGDLLITMREMSEALGKYDDKILLNGKATAEACSHLYDGWEEICMFLGISPIRVSHIRKEQRVKETLIIYHQKKLFMSVCKFRGLVESANASINDKIKAYATVTELQRQHSENLTR